ncbi:DUF4326 domain-containing protein [Isoptericola sp. NPDC056605]|uniref:DUF4326 domain-containing protein n=1 Tax=Isoptericola sp. NPDC056605 TaxID=3345876 RepID=UPI0036BA9F5C
MTAPKRIQLRRTKGWRKPEGTIVVARPSKWGNPFRVGGRIDAIDFRSAGVLIASRAEAVAYYRSHTATWRPDKVRAVQAELAGKDLACWCPLDQPCHADVLLEIANRRAR